MIPFSSEYLKKKSSISYKYHKGRKRNEKKRLKKIKELDQDYLRFPEPYKTQQYKNGGPFG